MKRLAITALILICIASEASAFELPTTKPEEPMIAQTAKLTPFNEKLYSLAFQVLIANSNLPQAFLVARAAIKAQPKSITWRKRYAEVSGWLGYPQIALQQWLTILDLKYSSSTLDQAIYFAKQLNDQVTLLKLYNLQLKHGVPLTKMGSALVETLEQLGQPTKALTLLSQLEQTKATLTKKAKIYQNVGNLNQALKALQVYNKKYGTNVKTATHEARIYISMNQIDTAYQVLNAAIAKANSSDKEYWQLLGELAWQTNNFDKAKAIYNYLYKHKDTDEATLARLASLTQSDNPELALEYAKQGLKQYKSIIFLSQVISLESLLGYWTELETLIKNLSPEQRDIMNQYPYFVLAQARIATENHDIAKAKQLYQEALSRWPDDPNMVMSYFDFILTQNNETELRKLARKYRLDPFYASYVAAAYIVLKQPEQALLAYERVFNANKSNPVWLLDYADLLDELNFDAEATKLRKATWGLVGNAKNEDRLNVLSRLAARGASADLTYNLMNTLHKARNKPNNTEFLMLLALAKQHYQMARYVYNHTNDNLNTIPKWMQLNLALSNNDLEKQRNLLNTAIEKLPHRDRTIAAQRTGEHRLMEELAYNGLAQFPNDPETYQLFQDIMLPNADWVKPTLEYKTYGPISGWRTQLQAKLFITPSFYIQPDIGNWQTHSTDKKQMINNPSHIRNYQLTVGDSIWGGELTVTGGQRQALRVYGKAEASWAYVIDNQLSYEFSLGYHQDSEETAALLLGGMKNEAAFILNNQLTIRDTISLLIRQNFFYGQDKVYLGSGQDYELFARHSFELGYPDWNAGGFIAVHRYHEDSDADSIIKTLIPSDANPRNTQIIPENFYDAGVMGGFGQSYLTTYTRDFKPFANIRLFRNSLNGLGAGLDGGIAGSVIGRDHLALYLDYSKNAQSNAQSNYIIGAQYTLFF